MHRSHSLSPSREQLVIRPACLRPGTVAIHGYKHAMVQVIAAAVAARAPVEIVGAPSVADTFVLSEMVRLAGGIARFADGRLFIDPTAMAASPREPQLSASIHGSLYLFPADATRFGAAEFHGAGGCQIGSSREQRARPVAHVLSIMERFGHRIEVRETGSHATRERDVDDVIIDIADYSTERGVMAGPLVGGATKTALLCGIGARRVELRNPYVKTDVLDLLRFLRAIGCEIERTADAIVMHGRPPRPARPVELELTSCVSETMTHIALSVHTGVEVTLAGVTPGRWKHGVATELQLLEEMGVPCTEGDGGTLHVRPPERVKSVDIEVVPAGIQSDHAPFFALMLLRGDRPAFVRERVWSERFDYVPGLRALGAETERTDDVIRITPSRPTRGAAVNATDVRAAAVLLVASLTSTSVTTIDNFQHAHRGYPGLIEQVRGLGADIEHGALA